MADTKVWGNPETDGTGIMSATAESKEHGAFGFQFHVPRDNAELVELVKRDPAKVMALVVDALKTDARGKAWGAQRTISQVTVEVAGKAIKTTGVMAAEIARLKAELAKAQTK